MKSPQRVVLVALTGLLLCSAGCACRQTETVALNEGGKIRRVPAAGFDEADYLKRGYVKNTDSKGDVIYVRVPATDTPPDSTFRGMGGGNTENSPPTDRGGGQGGGGMGSSGMGAGDNWR